MSNVSQWSVTASSNNDTPPDGWPEGMARGAVNNSARENMAAIARWYLDTKGALVSTGSSNAYVLTSNSSHAALADQSLLVFRANHANTGAATLNVDGLGAKAIEVAGAALVGGMIAEDALVAVGWNAEADAYDLLSVPAIGDEPGNLVRLEDDGSGGGALPAVDGASLANLPQVSPRGHISGLITSRGTATRLDVSAGAARSSDNTADIVLDSTLGKLIGTAFAEGDGEGSLDTGSVANSTWYYVHAIAKDDGTADVLTSLSVDSPTMPSGFTKRRRIGSFLTDGSAEIVPFRQTGDYFQWQSEVPNRDTSNPGTSPLLTTVTTPPNVETIVQVVVGHSNRSTTAFSTFGLKITSALQAAVTPTFDNSDLGVASVTNHRFMIAKLVPVGGGTPQIRTEQTNSGASDQLTVKTAGYFDRRGRDE